MSLSNEERNVLVALELKKARETYDEIEILYGAVIHREIKELKDHVS